MEAHQKLPMRAVTVNVSFSTALRQMPTCHPNAMRNRNIKYTLKAVKILRDDERNSFAQQFYFFFKHNLSLFLAMQKCSRFCHLLQGRDLVDVCWLTQAEKVAHPPSRHSFDLDEEPPIWNCFPEVIHPCCFTHTHTKRPRDCETQTAVATSHITVTDLSTSRSFSTDHIQPQTLFVKHSQRIWADSVQGKGLHADL